MLTNHLVFLLQSARREGQPCNEFTAYVMAHMGKATSDVGFDPAALPEAYSNLNIYTRVTRYTKIGKALHRDTWDPATAPLFGEAIIRAGGGKKHGRYWLGDSVVDTASTPTLSQLRARTTDSTPPILPRPEISVASMHAFQVISVSFVGCLRTFVSDCAIGVKSCRPG
jgi:hypothetical protein